MASVIKGNLTVEKLIIYFSFFFMVHNINYKRVKASISIGFA